MQDSSLFLHPFYFQISQKVILFSGFKNPRSSKTRVYSMHEKHFVERENTVRVENLTKTRVWRRLQFCPKTSTKIAIQEFHLRSITHSHVQVCGKKLFVLLSLLSAQKSWFKSFAAFLQQSFLFCNFTTTQCPPFFNIATTQLQPSLQHYMHNNTILYSFPSPLVCHYYVLRTYSVLNT